MNHATSSMFWNVVFEESRDEEPNRVIDILGETESLATKSRWAGIPERETQSGTGLRSAERR